VRSRTIYALASFGWRGSARHWSHVRAARGVIAGLAAVLVISVHSIVSMDFASGILPGWSSPIFPPYFVAGASYSGIAMVVTIVVPLRAWLGIAHTLDDALLDRLAKLMLAMGLAVTYAYGCEWWAALTAGDGPEREVLFHVRPFGAHAPIYWVMIAGNVLAPQLLWLRRVRRSALALFGVALMVDASMWAERLILIVTSQEHDFLPSSFGEFLPSPVDVAVLAGTIGFFALAMLVVLRVVPIAAISELKEDRHAERDEAARA
jgi:molybdopterin-containing oxidoreductase family membrane subunit